MPELITKFTLIINYSLQEYHFCKKKIGIVFLFSATVNVRPM